MFTRWLMNLETVHVASTEEEREAIYRFRYQVYVEELKKGFLKADHRRRQVMDSQDTAPGTTLFYTGSPKEVTGTLRVETWKGGEVPERIRKRFSLQLFPGIQDQEVAESSRLLISPSLRGRLVLPSLARAGYEHLCREHDVHFVFCYCAPGLVRAYRGLGFRPYGGELVCNQDGVRVPLVGVLSDLRYAQQMKAPVAGLIRQYYGHGPGKKLPLDMTPYSAVLQPGSMPFEMEPEEVWRHLQDRVMDQEADEVSSPFLEAISRRDLKKLSQKGFLMQVPAGRRVVRHDLAEKEMFLILDGVFEVEAGGRHLATLTAGEVFGEVALLADEGRRTATIRSLTPGKVMVLRRRFLAELMAEDPLLASRLLFNLSRILAARLSGMVERGSPPRELPEAPAAEETAPQVS